MPSYEVSGRNRLVIGSHGGVGFDRHRRVHESHRCPRRSRLPSKTRPQMATEYARHRAMPTVIGHVSFDAACWGQGWYPR